MKIPKHNSYDVLRVPRGTSDPDILKAAYRKQMQLWHEDTVEGEYKRKYPEISSEELGKRPDYQQAIAEAKLRSQYITEAKGILLDPDKKALYDNLGHNKSSKKNASSQETNSGSGKESTGSRSGDYEKKQRADSSSYNKSNRENYHRWNTASKNYTNRNRSSSNNRSSSSGPKIINGNFSGMNDLVHDGDIIINGNFSGMGDIISRNGSVVVNGNMSGSGDITARKDVSINGNYSGSGDISSARGNVTIRGKYTGMGDIEAPNGQVHRGSKSQRNNRNRNSSTTFNFGGDFNFDNINFSGGNQSTTETDGNMRMSDDHTSIHNATYIDIKKGNDHMRAEGENVSMSGTIIRGGTVSFNGRVVGQGTVDLKNVNQQFARQL